MNPFQKATRSQVFLKLALTGATGSGKTKSALRMASGLIEDTGKRIAVIDTENDSASLYSPPDGQAADGINTFDFDTLNVSPPWPAQEFADGLNTAMEHGYGVVIIDSASHLWKGVLAYKDSLDARGGNQYTNWKEPDKKFQVALDAVLQSKMHVIFCMRSKMDYILEDNGKGKQTPRKVGMAPIMKDGLEYEFSAVLDIAADHTAIASKDRTNLFPNDRIFQITEQIGRELSAWLKTATPKPEPPPKPDPKAEAEAKRLAFEALSPEEQKQHYIAAIRKLMKDKPCADMKDVTQGEYEKMYAGLYLGGSQSANSLSDIPLEQFKDQTKWRGREAVLLATHDLIKQILPAK